MSGVLLLMATGGWLQAEPAFSADASPYRVIVARNPFGLLPAPQAPDAVSSPASQPQLPNFRLSGIATLLGKTQVFLAMEERGQPLEYLTLVPGQKVGAIELRNVEVDTGTVHLLVHGRDIFLSFKGQQEETRAAQLAEQRFVQEHTRAHEELQARERQRLEAESRAQKLGSQ